MYHYITLINNFLLCDIRKENLTLVKIASEYVHEMCSQPLNWRVVRSICFICDMY